jgi:hypothetical protein
MTCAHKAIQIPDTQFDPLTDLDLGSILLIGLKSVFQSAGALTHAVLCGVAIPEQLDRLRWDVSRRVTRT